MIVIDQASVMLLSEPFFRTFTDNQLCDTSTATGGLFALSCQTGSDLDGHHWEALWMDPKASQ